MKPLTFLLMLLLGTIALTLSASPQAVSVPPSTPGSDTAEDPEFVDGLPGPLYPGTRNTRAEIQPPRSPRTARTEETSNPPLLPPSGVRAIAGRLSATEGRARDDARLWLEREVADWVDSDVPHHWKVPKPLIDQMIVRTRIKPISKDYGTVYEATVVADFSPERRTAIVSAYQRDLVARRMTRLGGVILFLLACLAALAGYIRTDEATKGYYTNWLRLAAAAGVGASGVLVYRLLT